MELRSCPRNHAQETSVPTGSVLCIPCIQQLERHLLMLPGLHEECLHDISSPPRRINPTKVSGSRKRDHLNISMLDIRHDILAILESWSGIVVEKLGAVAPDRTVPHLARFLIRNLDWLAAQPPAAEFADEIENLHIESVRAIDPDSGDRSAPVTGCVVDNCQGTINTSPQNTRNAAKSGLSCSAGHSWEMHEWLILRHLMDRQRRDAA